MNGIGRGPAKKVEMEVGGTFSLKYTASDGEYRAVDWDYGDMRRRWSETYTNGVRWYEAGELSEEGHRVILERFGLIKWASAFPIERVRITAPAELMEARRTLERAHRLDRLEVLGENAGFRLPAEQWT